MFGWVVPHRLLVLDWLVLGGFPLRVWITFVGFYCLVLLLIFCTLDLWLVVVLLLLMLLVS